MQQRFSDRFGYRSSQQEISIREDAPEGLRHAIPLLAEEAGMEPSAMRMVVCRVLLIQPDSTNWTEFPNIWDEVNQLLAKCQWFKVYDVAEALFSALGGQFIENAEHFQHQIDQYLRENGIGWQMAAGQITYRGTEIFVATTNDASTNLERTGRVAAAQEIHEAMQDISRRPNPDVTGAIQHAIAALECAARDITGEPNSTLGRLVSGLGLTPPLDKAVEKLWGYSSEQARHVREGQQAVSTVEAELVVSVACAVCSFLAKRGPRGSA